MSAGPSRRHLGGLALGGLALMSSARSPAAVLPARPWRLTVAYPPGGVSDETARLLAAGLQPRLGQAVRVDHRPGAGGALALEALGQDTSDAPHLCFCAITPLLNPRWARLWTGPAAARPAPVAAVMRTPVLVVATTACRAQGLADLLHLAARAPGDIRWASSGVGTTGHLVMAQLAQLAGVVFTHVPYQGGGQQLTDALAGQFEVLSTNVGPRQLADVQAGRLRPLAVGAPQRLAVLPQVPTLAELGHAAANLSSLFGLFAPGRWPVAALDALHHPVQATRSAPSFVARLLAGGHAPAVGSRADFVAQIEAERARWPQGLVVPDAA